MYINWKGPLEWSDGTPVHLAPYDDPQALSRNVNACPLWEKHTHDNYVAVDRNTGLILGCEDEDYPHIRNVATRPPVYLHMFHGRKTDGENMDGWGFNGPTIGPLKWVHMTYMCHLRGEFQDGHDAKVFGLDQEFDFKINGDCLEFDGYLFGDWSISTERCTMPYELRVGEPGHGTISGQLELTYHEALTLFEKEKEVSPESLIQLIDVCGDHEVVIAEHRP